MTNAGAQSSDRYRDFFDAAMREPMAWLRLDSDFLDDPKVQRLAYLEGGRGWEAVGVYIGLMARLAGGEHILDVSDDFGWAVLQSLSLIHI